MTESISPINPSSNGYYLGYHYSPVSLSMVVI